MSFIKILSIVTCLCTNIHDTIFRVCTYNDTVFITSNDIVHVDTFSLFELSCLLSKEMSDSLRSLEYDSCQIYYHLRNKDWFLLQEYEIRSARIPEGYYITTDFGKIVYKENLIHIGYNYPEKIKRKRNYLKRYWTRPKF